MCSALQVIEKMEQVLEDKLRKRSKHLQDKPQGKPSMRESAPRLSSRPCSCLENPMDRGAWQTTVPRIAKSVQEKDLT